MPDISHEEVNQHQITSIRQRYKKCALRTIIVWLLAVHFLALAIAKHNMLVGSILYYSGMTFGFFLVGKWMVYRFVQRLPLEERHLVVEASIRAGKKIFNPMLVDACNTAAPQKEYLRASSEPQDETLLRAAAYTETAPQDQLLRPTDSREEVRERRERHQE